MTTDLPAVPQDQELERLRARVANLERLTHRLAHELATPLTTARGFAGVLLDREGLDDTARDGLVRIERAVRTAEDMLRARVEEATDDQPRALRLRPLVRDAAVEELGVRSPVGRALPDDLRVFGDPDGMRLAVHLLLRAAAEHARLHGVDPSTVEVALGHGPADVVELRCHVAAPGLDDAQRSAALYGSDEEPDGVPALLRRLHVGLGGLGGRLWLRDPDGDAATFTTVVQLPRDVGSDAATRA